MEAAAPPPDLMILRAVLKQYFHDFEGALVDLNALLDRNPGNMQAWLIKGNTEIILGRYESADASCKHLSGSVQPMLAALCSSRIMALTGNQDKALDLQRLFINRFATEKSLQQWSLSIAAETAIQLGDNKQAERFFRRALAIPPRDPFTLKSYSDLMLSQKRYAEVVDLLRSEQGDDGLLLRLAIAAGKVDDVSLAAKTRGMMESRLEAARLRGSRLHELDEAIFHLELGGDYNAALVLAKRNWQTQKSLDDLRLLARAGVKAGDKSTVELARVWAIKHKLKDAVLTELLEQAGEP